MANILRDQNSLRGYDWQYDLWCGESNTQPCSIRSKWNIHPQSSQNDFAALVRAVSMVASRLREITLRVNSTLGGDTGSAVVL